MPTRTRAATARSPNANRRDSSNTTGSQGQGAAGRAPTGGSTVAPGRARSVGRGVTERQTRGSDDTTSRRSVPASAAISTRGAVQSKAAASTSTAAAAPEAGRTTTTASTRNSRRTSVTTRDGDRRRSTSQPEATTTAASTTTSAAALPREGHPAPSANVATSAAATSSIATSATATSGTTTSATGTSGTTTSATATSGTTTSGTTTTSASRTARPHSGAPPTYEESVNHLTLEYGGYFVPYESRPIATPLTNVSSLSYSQVNLAGRGAVGHRGSRNSVGPIGVPVDRRLIDERSPRGRRQRRVGDLALTASERVVITEPVTRELEEAEEEDNGSCTKLLLPPMHICMATTCLVFNCVIPGSGTLVAAFGLFCCTKPDEWSCGKKIASSCLCLLVALAQIILTPVLLIGWIWSILWGFAYVGVSHQEYHGIKDDDDDEDELATIASGRGIRGLSDLEDEDTPWALGYHRFDHPTSAPSQRRMSLAGTGSQVELEQRRQASMLRATRSYGYVEVHGVQGGAYGSIDHHRLARTRLQRPPGSGTGSSNTLNSNRPMSQTTLTSYINDGMFLNNPPPPQPVRTHPPSMVTIDM